MPNLSRDEFVALARAQWGLGGEVAIPLALRVLSDQLTPVLAYRRLVSPDERGAPSFLLESVEGGERQGRYSILSSRPVVEVVAHADEVEVTDHRAGGGVTRRRHARPLEIPRELTAGVRLVSPSRGRREQLPACVLGGWCGFVGYDAVRYGEPEKLPFSAAPRDDRGLPDLHLGLYDRVVVFDHVDKIVFLVQVAFVRDGGDAGVVYDEAMGKLRALLARVQEHSKPLASGLMPGEDGPGGAIVSNTTRDEHARMVARALEYIRAGDIFQVVVGQRFERVSGADPFDVYRALRAVNPSPYMVYMQGKGCILVASSPEILCRVSRDGAGRMIVTNRPLAGTRRRGTSEQEDAALERELRADRKEVAEHVMLVDLGRNDVGRVAQPGSIELPGVLEVERYSHVMHLSSTVTGVMREGLDAWDALAATLPVGTISGAPKVRAMQIIDELEPVRRGPYGGGMGYVGLDGQMDIALTLRTIVAPFALAQGLTRGGAARWTYHLQAAGGIVADSRAEDEYVETVNKSAALARAIDVAERAFGGRAES